jgi:hypothetical protein
MSEFNTLATTVSEVYDESVLSRQQIQAGITTIQNFNSSSPIRWQVLLAQMQSGKTETFLFIAAEMIRLGLIERAVIFSGNAETDLKNQLIKEVEGKAGSRFWRRYEVFLNEEIGLRLRELVPIIEKIKLNIPLYLLFTKHLILFISAAIISTIHSNRIILL